VIPGNHVWPPRIARFSSHSKVILKALILSVKNYTQFYAHKRHCPNNNSKLTLTQAIRLEHWNALWYYRGSLHACIVASSPGLTRKIGKGAWSHLQISCMCWVSILCNNYVFYMISQILLTMALQSRWTDFATGWLQATLVRRKYSSLASVNTPLVSEIWGLWKVC